MIEILDFTKTYGIVKAVHELTLRVDEGQVFGLIGSNGAGKTTILRFLATLIEPTRGAAFVNGYSVTAEVRKVRRSIGYMPDRFGYYPGMRVWEFLDFFAAAYGIRQWRRQALIDDLLQLVDLDDKRFEPVDGLSRGMKQRLGLVKALVHDPPLLILDEPASGLDPRARVEVKEFLRELTAMGKTILISSHILSELADICTSVGIIERGTLLAQGAIDEVLASVRDHRIYSLRIAKGADTAHDLLRNNDQVFDLETGSNQFRFSFKGSQEETAALLSALVALEVQVVELREEPIDLEEAFFKLTKGEVA
jgi:ABC-2 type transport system ATP-binding protein